MANGVRQNLLGQRFGKLIVTGSGPDGVCGKARWTCLCDCGTETLSYANNLIRGKSLSCGCARKEHPHYGGKTHGESCTRLFRIWVDMRSRCKYPSTTHYHRYGGRGISVCTEWEISFEAFRDWALNNGYSDSLTIDRIDNDGNYEPSNCRWVTNRENCKNRVHYTHRIGERKVS
jgi:hypothetical protein